MYVLSRIKSTYILLKYRSKVACNDERKSVTHFENTKCSYIGFLYNAKRTDTLVVVNCSKSVWKRGVI
jgi:hypothetical protein